MFVPFFAAFLVSLLVTPPTTAWLTRRQVMDVPNARSSHAVVVPRGGGLAVLSGVGVGVVLAVLIRDQGTSAWDHPLALGLDLGAAALCFAALGLRDDLVGLPAGFRLVAQLVLSSATVAVIVWAAPVPSWAWALPGGAVWVAGYVNAFNFMDGINGISAVSATLAGGWFCLLGTQAHDEIVSVFAAALAGAALGFLPWNAPRARVFLGDVGSYGVGALIAALALLTAVREDNLWVGLAPAALYVADTGWTLVRRLVRGEPVFEAHRTHVYQRLTDRGLTHVATTGVVGGCTLVVLGAAWFLPTGAALVAAVVVSAGYLALPHALGHRQPEVAR